MSLFAAYIQAIIRTVHYLERMENNYKKSPNINPGKTAHSLKQKS